MKVTVLLFAQLADAAGCERLAVHVPEGATVAELLDEIGRTHPALAVHWDRIAVAVDEAYCSLDRALHPGQTVALIPPVSGG